MVIAILNQGNDHSVNTFAVFMNRPKKYYVTLINIYDIHNNIQRVIFFALLKILILRKKKIVYKVFIFAKWPVQTKSI